VRILYRARQFWHAIKGKPNPEDLDQVADLLTERQMRLFSQMQPSEQVHGLSVYRKLVNQGEDQDDLLVAALLHDVGKSRQPINALERALIVLVKSIAPEQVKVWGSANGNGENASWFRRPLILYEQHPTWGADMAKEAGVSPQAEMLIRRHQQLLLDDPQNVEDELLIKLQAVDDTS
jgi:putative nucleotidyltransferase with HDIG domain